MKEFRYVRRLPFFHPYIYSGRTLGRGEASGGIPERMRRTFVHSSRACECVSYQRKGESGPDRRSRTSFLACSEEPLEEEGYLNEALMVHG